MTNRVFWTRFVLVSSLVLLGAVGYETVTNSRGPLPAPDDASRKAGRELLDAVLRTHHADAFHGRDSLRFDVVTSPIARAERRLAMTVDLRSRSADFRMAPDSGASGRLEEPGMVYHLEARTETITPRPGRRQRELTTYGPSLVWWALFPGNLLDPAAEVWRLPDARIGAKTVARLAVRWRGEMEWFELHLDPVHSSILSVDFIDERFSPLFRWRASFEAGRVDDAGPRSFRWRFTPARPLFRTLSGNTNFVVISYTVL